MLSCTHVQAAKDYRTDADSGVMLSYTHVQAAKDYRTDADSGVMLSYTHVQAAKDYRTDADLHAACEPDAKQLCADVNPGQGRIQVRIPLHIKEPLFEDASCQHSPQMRQCSQCLNSRRPSLHMHDAQAATQRRLTEAVAALWCARGSCMPACAGLPEKPGGVGVMQVLGGAC